MIIDCPECKKKFNIDQNLIPAQGRLLQCGSCDHKWFFNSSILKKKKKKLSMKMLKLTKKLKERK